MVYGSVGNQEAEVEGLEGSLVLMCGNIPAVLTSRDSVSKTEEAEGLGVASLCTQ